MEDLESKYTGRSDEWLTEQIAVMSNKANAYQSLLKECRLREGEFRRELDRRLILSLPIKVGDLIYVTPDMFPKYAKYAHEAFEAKIEAIANYGGDEVRIWIGRGGATIEDALKMRQAYLERVGNE